MNNDSQQQNQKKRFMLVGGGSGGHLTPLVAVAESIKALDKSSTVIFVGQKGENLHDIVDRQEIDESARISAGKFRRYHGESLWQHLTDVKTIALNIRDLFKFLLGILQAIVLLSRKKPDAIFLKGGFVSVPVGYAARLLRIPYITHDSDAIPGLANKMTAKHARYNTTALPIDLYPYDKHKARHVGIPLNPAFQPIDAHALARAKKALGYGPTSKVVFSVGGGLGAQKLNIAMVDVASTLLKKYQELFIIHITGKKLFNETARLYEKHLDATLQKRVRIIDFTTTLHEFSAAADVVVTRAGATNIAEFAAQAKPCIIVPNPVLTGGQQLHNARVITDADAAVIVDEKNIGTLPSKVEELLSEHESSRSALGARLHDLSHEGAADRLAELLFDVTKENTGIF